ncbi:MULTISPECIES: GNAT family N-acetyltransferase [unclassified Bacillus (in: firmicutes)]|uniref:GNAT family N-acetyltransferase n=1 Tax=unclassified Bacillus (in: firmicutes) TaxID=185979 RepID=UPI001BEC7893|nr:MULTISPECIES: GNAT family N-acetyltransferase [unclassified Bacillus (in: firmicutes)]MBT2638272.1 GNAT family N-acetyltransferase [Bacillus sp. ISL-39]MBT2661372.1 GNAT family N-acetyltransferase [Bacillus sp. ISL-45]
MNLYSREMTKELAMDILSWHYDPPYDFYNNEVNNDAIYELLNEGYTAVEDEEGNLIGFYCSGHSAQVPKGRMLGAYTEPAIDVGIGIHPKLTGKGNGYLFLSFVLNELAALGSHAIFRLTVAGFNKRAIKLYEKVGFRDKYHFKTDITEFIIMVKW